MNYKQHHLGMTTTAAAVTLMFGAFSAPTAAVAGDLSSTFQAGVNQIHDVSGEDYLPHPGNITGQIEVGDVFLGVIDIGKNNNTGANYGQGSVNPQLTGIFAVQVASVTAAGTVSNGNTNVQAVNVTFGAFNVGTALAAAGFVAPVPLASALLNPTQTDGNTFAYVFSDPTDPLAGNYVSQNCSSALACQAAQQVVLGDIASGALAFSLDVNPTDVLGENNVPLNVADVTTGLSGTDIGGAEPGSKVSVLFQDVPHFIFSPTVAFAGNLAVPLGTIYPVDDSTTFTLNATVPEPASLALLGSALLTFGYLRRRRRS